MVGRKVVAGMPIRAENAPETGYYPAQVVGLLGLDGMTYDTLRRLRGVIRMSQRDRPAAVPRDSWSRWTPEDLARLDVLVELCGGRDALQPGRRLNMRGVIEACTSLIELGCDDPLLEVSMARAGSKIVAFLDGFVFEPATGQAVMPVARGGLHTDDRSSAAASVRAARESVGLTGQREVELARAARLRARHPSNA